MTGDVMEWPDKCVELTDDTYDGFVRQYPVAMVDFWGPSCAPCKMVAPILDQLSTEMKGKVAIGKVNVTKNFKTPAKLSVRSIPTLAFYRNGTLVKSKVGFVPKAGILAELTALWG